MWLTVILAIALGVLVYFLLYPQRQEGFNRYKTMTHLPSCHSPSGTGLLGGKRCKELQKLYGVTRFGGPVPSDLSLDQLKTMGLEVLHEPRAQSIRWRNQQNWEL